MLIIIFGKIYDKITLKTHWLVAAIRFINRTDPVRYGLQSISGHLCRINIKPYIFSYVPNAFKKVIKNEFNWGYTSFYEKKYYAKKLWDQII